MKKYVQPIIVPSLTFILGILIQILLQKWLDTKDPVLLTLLVISLCVTIILIVLLYFSKSFDTRFDALDHKLVDVATRAGLLVEYIEDGEGFLSYQRTTELILKAESSITFVDYWIPYRDYQVKARSISRFRSDYYKAATTQIKNHKNDKNTFHRRIVQVPSELLNAHIPFEIDPPFLEYLHVAAEIQDKRFTSCKIKLASAHIKMPFIMIDQRYIILPILISDNESQKHTRHGALFFDDRHGNLVKCFMTIYNAVDAHARPLEVVELTTIE